ncbi:nucleoside-diphosphate kinase [Candidatus Babeliales bacterium]|nr:nucleoside-diphosphate kinase [Candidatus Babeliales bacterium]
MIEQTFAIIKPGAVADKVTGKIISMIEDAGFDIVEMAKIEMTEEQAQELYAEHAEKPFFAGMVQNMTASPIIIMQLQKENAIAAWRELMGATNPANAAEGTIRKLYGRNIDHNATHGSDSAVSAARELNIFFGCCCD